MSENKMRQLNLKILLSVIIIIVLYIQSSNEKYFIIYFLECTKRDAFRRLDLFARQSTGNGFERGCSCNKARKDQLKVIIRNLRAGS